MAALIRDLRYVSRTLLHSPAFAVSVVLILALGIGASAALFTLVDAYYLRPPSGVSDPGRLLDVRGTRGRDLDGPISYPDYVDLRDRSRAFSGLMAYRATVLDVGRGSEPRRVQAALVSSDYFAVLGARPVRGRTLLPEDERGALGSPVAVISHRLWQGFFGGDPDLVGKTVTLNGRGFTVVGVAAPGFRGHTTSQAFDLWVPLALFAVADPGALASVASREWRWLTVVGRLAPGADLAQAQAELSVLARQREPSGSGNGDAFGVSLAPTWPSLLADAYAMLLIASVGVLFLIACANLSNLFLARASARRKEVAARLALGATRGRVLQLFLAESVVLGALGGAAGLLIAPSTAGAVLAWSSAGVQEFPDAVDLYLSGNLAAFVLVLSLLSGILLGVGPALGLSRLSVAAGLKEGGRQSTSRSRLRALLVILQISLSLVLLSGAGLLFRTLRNYQSLIAVPEPERVLLLSLQPSHQQYDDARARELYSRLIERVEGLPGVRAASVARDVSVSDASFFTERVAVGPVVPGADASWTDVAYDAVAPGFFRTMGARLEAGRDFSAQDREGAAPVVIVGSALARRLWPGGIPLGQRLWIAGERSAREVIGVAGDRPSRDGLRPFLYYPLFQRYPWAGSRHTLFVRTSSGSPLALVPAVRREAGALDANLPLFNPRTLDKEIAGGHLFERLAGAVVGGSGMLALLLAAIGLHGVTSHWVSQRLPEFGIRMAMGASTRDVFLLVVRHGMTLSLVGVATGLAAALALNRVWASLLYGVRPMNPAVLAAVALLLIATTLVASYLPARQATKVDPMTVIRAE